MYWSYAGKNFRRRRLWLLVLSVVGLLVACNQSGNDSAGPVVVTEVIEMAGEEVVITRVVRQTVAVTATPATTAVPEASGPIALDVGYVGPFPSIDPQQSEGGNALALVENLFAGLTNYNHDTNQIEPELARSWQVENGRIWTFNLREDMFWVRPSPAGNGRVPEATPVRPIIADDVVYAVHRICDPTVNVPDAFLYFIIQGCESAYNTVNPTENDLEAIGVRAVDDHTLEVTLNQPANHFLTLTSMWPFYPVPSAEIGRLQEENPSAVWTDPEQVLTSGPFVPVTSQGWGQSRAILYRNSAWPLPFQGNVEIVNVNYLEDGENAFTLWDAKSLDLSPLPAAQRETMLNQETSKAQLITNQTVFYLGFNFDSGVFREPEVRRAFAAAIDREALADALYGGGALPMRHLTPPGVYGAPPINEVGRGYSPDYARQQMQSSGFRSCRLMPPIRFLVSTSDLSLQQAELIRGMWVDELNCEETQIQIDQVQFGTLLANTRPDAGAARPDVWELGWSSYFPDAHNWLYELLHCTESENRTNRPCDQADTLLVRANGSAAWEERITLYREVENLFFGGESTMPLAPLYVRGDYTLVQTWLTDYVLPQFGGPHFDTFALNADLKRLERSRTQ